MENDEYENIENFLDGSTFLAKDSTEDEYNKILRDEKEIIDQENNEKENIEKIKKDQKDLTKTLKKIRRTKNIRIRNSTFERTKKIKEKLGEIKNLVPPEDIKKLC